MQKVLLLLATLALLATGWTTAVTPTHAFAPDQIVASGDGSGDNGCG